MMELVLTEDGIEHSELDDDLILGSICHKTINLFVDDRYIYFLNDAPHLLKRAAGQLLPLFWDAVGLLELRYNL